MRGSANVEIYLGAMKNHFVQAVESARKDRLIERLSSKDATVFGKTGAALASIKNRLGWLDCASALQADYPNIDSFAQEVIGAGFTRIVLLGMGGSSLAPEVFKTTFGLRVGVSSFQVLDSTDPLAIKMVRDSLEPSKTIFFVSSKSGKTIETLSHAKYFWKALEAAKVKNPGQQFVAITDSGSDLEAFAKERGFRKVFINPSDIGGRYSALSYFGLVPAAFTRMNSKIFLESALSAEEGLKIADYDRNSAFRIGALLGVAAEKGVDKLSIVASASLKPFAPWLEQLIAESTGKEGKAVIPIDAEPIGGLSDYGSDRIFLFLELAGETDAALTRLFESARSSGSPAIYIRFSKLEHLGFEFLRQEFATAVAGYFLGINPFDEPNVQESKDNTAAILSEYEKDKPPKEPKKLVNWENIELLSIGSAAEYGPEDVDSAEKVWKRFFTAVQRHSYVALLNFAAMSPENERAVARFRRVLRAKLGVATLRGYGPRYLHSIGQLYKGGPGAGFFIVFSHASKDNTAIPDAKYTFLQLRNAQRQGDMQALVKRDLPTLVFSISGDFAEGIALLTEHLDKAFKNLRVERRTEGMEEEESESPVMSMNEE